MKCPPFKDSDTSNTNLDCWRAASLSSFCRNILYLNRENMLLSLPLLIPTNWNSIMLA